MSFCKNKTTQVNSYTTSKRMKAEIEVICKEFITPSSPTPNHLRHYQLSFLDNRAPKCYAPMVLFYEFNAKTQPSIADISKHLKKSLAEALTLFYPLAGRVSFENNLVDCNDEGIPFLEARVTNKCRLVDVINNPDADELNTFIPFQVLDHVEFALGVQLNIFECGGFAVGLCISHKLADGLSLLVFTKTWTDIAHGSQDHNDNNQKKIECPELVSASLFPPKEYTGYDLNGYLTNDKVTKRFVFSASTIEALKAKLRGSGSNHRKGPSSVETLSTFIWRRLIKATKDDAEGTLHTLVHLVNLRPKFDPPLPPHSFGNIFHFSMTALSSTTTSSSSRGGGDEEDQKRTCRGIIHQVREGIDKIDKGYVRRLQHGDEHLRFVNQLVQSLSRSDKVVMSSCSSLCTFPLYENDFGWGRPVWVGLPPLPYNNFIVLADTKEIGGIEAYISLADPDAMTRLENDPFLRRQVGMNRMARL